MGGATEAQKAEGVLHLHFFLYLQMAHQFHSIEELADLFREKLLSLESMKFFHDHLRCAAYPDVAKFEAEREQIETSWPAYAADRLLSKPPWYIWSGARTGAAPHLFSGTAMEAWMEEGHEWKTHNADRLQHVLSRMNHHIHPIINAETGERKPLGACQPKNRPMECKHGFPLDNELCAEALLICPCIAKERGLPATGPRSCIGTILPQRNHAWLNAAPTAWAIIAADNGDVKFPLRVPILPETHEVFLYDIARCCK